jgi:hypothetical protein
VQHIQNEQKKAQAEQKKETRHIQDALSILVQNLKDDPPALSAVRLLQRSQPESDPSDDTGEKALQIPDDFSSNLLAIMSSRHNQEMITFQKRVILESLKFEDMPYRHQAISTAYERTFEWIYTEPELKPKGEAGPVEELEPVAELQESNLPVESSSDTSSLDLAPTDMTVPRWNSFVEWLRSDDNLYWITGKPGAGKSTLMKFIYHNSRTYENIERWADKVGQRRNKTAVRGLSKSGSMLWSLGGQALKSEVDTAAFFFWNSGTKDQMSKIGFLKTVLSQLLSKHRNLIPNVFPDRWLRYELLGGDSRPYTWFELKGALDVILSDTSRLFFFLIDGLDEFDGKSSELADYVLEVSNRSNVKICASSRPWLAFEDKFEGHPNLRVEDLTRLDILTYITGQFDTSKRFADLKTFKPHEAAMLIQQVADRATGVFLWVYVVTGSLMDGLQNGDNIAQLKQTLDSLPTELEELFERILHRLDPIYAKEASEMFQFVRAYPEDSTLMGVYLSNFPMADALNLRLDPIPNSELPFHEDGMRRQLYSRCKCLLEVTNLEKGQPRVSFLHRTVKDYLQDPEVWRHIRGNYPDYEPETALIISLILQAKTRITCSRETWRHEGCRLHKCLAKAFHLTVSSETLTDTVKVDLIAQIDRADRDLPVAGRLLNLDHELDHSWHVHALSEHSSKLRNVPRRMKTFQLALLERLDWLAAARVDQDVELLHKPIDGEPLLAFCAVSRKWDLVQVFLTKGSDLNTGDPQSVAWKELLQTANNTDAGSSNLKVIATLMGLFLDQGADIRVETNGRRVKHVVNRLAIELECKEGKQEPERLRSQWQSAARRRKQREGWRWYYKRWA